MTSLNKLQNPKVFISYSWTTPDHEQWVINLATQLRETGVDAILDKWDLKQGHDANVFMEGMVTDLTIEKVIMVVDKYYAEKANARSGGVGTEAQIISKELYDKKQQDKFVAVIVEKDDNGKLCSPVFCSSRIHIDFTDSEKYAEKLEELQRWIFDKPLHIKPEIGKIPEFIANDNPVQIGTTASFGRVIDSIKNSKPNAIGALNDYLEIFSSEFEKFRITSREGVFDDWIVKSIDEFLPYHNQFIQLLITIAKYTSEEEYAIKLHKFFEQLIPYMYRPKNVRQWSETDWDNFKFIIHELFLYTIAVFLKHEKFEYANYLMQHQYYVARNIEEGRNALMNSTAISVYINSLDNTRNRRLGLNLSSLHADLLKDRAVSSGVEFSYIMQADFVLFMRAEIEKEGRWHPVTLVYSSSTFRYVAAFEIFTRAQSKSYFNKQPFCTYR